MKCAKHMKYACRHMKVCLRKIKCASHMFFVWESLSFLTGLFIAIKFIIRRFVLQSNTSLILSIEVFGVNVIALNEVVIKLPTKTDSRSGS